MLPHTGGGQLKDALIIVDDSCGALLLQARMNSPTRFF